MKKNCSDELIRLQRVIMSDNAKVSNGVLKILKEDAKKFFSGFFDVDNDSVKVDLSVNENGAYQITLSATGTNIKNVKSI